MAITKKIIKGLVLWAGCMIVLSAQVFAAPAVTGVSGQLAHGASITITGSGFGTKASAAPLKYDSFESGTAGQDLGNGWVFSTSHDRNPKYSAKFLRPNSIMSGMADFSGNQYLSSFGVRDMTNGYPEVYMDFWYLYDPASPPSRNHKLFRFYTGTDSGQPDRYMNVFCGTGWTMESDGGGTSKWYGSPWWEWTNADKQWSHFQGYFKTNTDGASNGIIKFWINHYKGIDASNWVHQPSGSSVWRSLWFGNYLGHDAAAGCGVSPGNSYTFWDNVYIDTTQARVEIGNAANYESCTHREIQVPSSWSESSITFTINKGSFANFNQVYLFVIDRNGSVSPGHPLCPACPRPPVITNIQ
jgi:hypothetical protein